MPISIIRRLAPILAAAFCAVLSAPWTASAQTSPPDVTGSYFTSGLSSVYDCSMGLPGQSEAIFLYVNVTTQDGSFIAGSIGGPTPESAVISFSADVLDDGSFTGDWSWVAIDTNAFFQQRAVHGQFTEDAVEMDLTSLYGDPEVFTCEYRISLSSEASVLTWLEPDPNATVDLAPPRALTIGPLEMAGAKLTTDLAAAALRPWNHAARTASPRAGQPTGYNVYRSNTPNVQPTSENLFTSVASPLTTVPVPNGVAGSFFVVTATYDTGESGPSNEVSGGVAAATVTSVKVSARIKAKGTGFSPTVQVFVDGIPFQKAAKVKNGTRVTQTGQLITGQTLSQYITQGKTVAISFRNENGGIATQVYTKP